MEVDAGSVAEPDRRRGRRVRLLALLIVATVMLMGASAGVAQASSVTNPSVTLVTTPAAGARSEYLVDFTTSPGGTLTAPSARITVTFPTGSDITTALGNTFVRDVTANNATVGGCSKSGVVATCSLNGGQTIPGGHQLEIEFDGVINPPAGQQSLTISTTADADAVHPGYSIQTGGQISQPAVTLVTTPAAGARSEYLVDFTTSSPNGTLSNLALSQITVTFPTGSDITTALGNTFVRDVTANNATVGGCSKSGVVATCSLNGGQTIPGGHQLEIEFDCVINPAAGPQTLSVKTTSDLPATASGTYNIQTGGQISQPAVTLVTTPAAGARSEYLVDFTTSSPNGTLSNLALSQITVTFPTGSDITTALGNTFVRDVTANNATVGGCSKSGVVATCSLNGGQTIPGGHQLEIEFDGVINPAAGPQTLSVKTTSDLPATASGTYNIQTGGQISQPAVTLVTTPAAGARSEYLVDFTTSSPNGTLSNLALSQITVTFPTGSDITTALGNTFVRDVTANNATVGGCSKSGVVATCSLNGGQTIPGGHQLEIEFDGVINPAAGPQTLSVKTTSDLPATASGTYNIQTGGQISQPAVTLVTTPAAGARSEYLVDFTTSSPNGTLSNLALSQITVTFPTGSDITTALGNTFVRDVTANNATVGGCSKSGVVATCSLNGGQTIPGGHRLEIEFDGVINPAAGPQTLSVKTTSDLPATASGTYNIQTGGQISQPAVTLKQPRPRRSRSPIFHLVHDLVAERDAVEPGAEPDHGHVPDRQRHHDGAGEHVRQGRDREQRDRRGVQQIGGGRDLQPQRRPDDPRRPPARDRVRRCHQPIDRLHH